MKNQIRIQIHKSLARQFDGLFWSVYYTCLWQIYGCDGIRSGHGSIIVVWKTSKTNGNFFDFDKAKI